MRRTFHDMTFCFAVTLGVVSGSLGCGNSMETGTTISPTERAMLSPSVDSSQDGRGQSDIPEKQDRPKTAKPEVQNYELTVGACGANSKSTISASYQSAIAQQKSSDPASEVRLLDLLAQSPDGFRALDQDVKPDDSVCYLQSVTCLACAANWFMYSHDVVYDCPSLHRTITVHYSCDSYFC